MLDLKLDKRFQKNVKGRFEKYYFEVGILKDESYKLPKKGQRGKGGRDVLTTFAGGPARMKSGKDSGLMISDISERNRERMGVNYLTAPFKKRSSEIIQFTKKFFQVVTGPSQPKRLENLLQAVVRNPILRGDYGKNKPMTRKIKGFSRLMIDTAQLFRGITARVRLGRRV